MKRFTTKVLRIRLLICVVLAICCIMQLSCCFGIGNTEMPFNALSQVFNADFETIDAAVQS